MLKNLKINDLFKLIGPETASEILDHFTFNIVNKILRDGNQQTVDIILNNFNINQLHCSYQDALLNQNLNNETKRTILRTLIKAEEYGRLDYPNKIKIAYSLLPDEITDIVVHRPSFLPDLTTMTLSEKTIRKLFPSQTTFMIKTQKVPLDLLETLNVEHYQDIIITQPRCNDKLLAKIIPTISIHRLFFDNNDISKRAGELTVSAIFESYRLTDIMQYKHEILKFISEDKFNNYCSVKKLKC